MAAGATASSNIVVILTDDQGDACVFVCGHEAHAADDDIHAYTIVHHHTHTHTFSLALCGADMNMGYVSQPKLVALVKDQGGKPTARHTITHTITHTLSHTHTHLADSLCLSPSPSLSVSFSALYHTHAHTHHHTHTHLSVSLSALSVTHNILTHAQPSHNPHTQFHNLHTTFTQPTHTLLTHPAHSPHARLMFLSCTACGLRPQSRWRP